MLICLVVVFAVRKRKKSSHSVKLHNFLFDYPEKTIPPSKDANRTYNTIEKVIENAGFERKWVWTLEVHITNS